MKIKYAIYKSKVGLRAIEYVDTKEGLRGLPYIKEEYLPVIINRMGGYTGFDLEIEKKQGFIEIIEVEEEQEPLTREQMYPKNSKDFEYGWINPEGDSYATGHEEHSRSADIICEELGYKVYNGERELEKRGWLKVTGSWEKGNLIKTVYCETFRVTKKQVNALLDLGLHNARHVKDLIYISERNW